MSFKNNTKKQPEPRKAPVHKIFVSGVIAAIWENQSDHGKVRHNVTLQRSFRTENGYGQTESFGGRDLQNLRKAADEAHSWILAQQRSSSEEGEE